MSLVCPAVPSQDLLLMPAVGKGGAVKCFQGPSESQTPPLGLCEEMSAVGRLRALGSCPRPFGALRMALRAGPSPLHMSVV